MKKTSLFVIILFFVAIASPVSTAWSQKKKLSPKAKASGTINGVDITINYHQPSAKGRVIMGKLVPYNKVWRTGANNSTSISLGDNVMIEGKKLEKGEYGLYTIPNKNSWTIIFNKDIGWGAYDYDEAKDVLRVSVTPQKTKEYVETFMFDVEKNKVTMQWENTKVSFSVSKM